MAALPMLEAEMAFVVRQRGSEAWKIRRAAIVPTRSSGLPP
jgi:hypothetical protein